jgi:hypothetical protein
MLILLTGLQAIPDEVYEAATVDGAGRWLQFTGITLPLLRPTIALVLILMTTGSLLAFDQFYILTNGGPDNSTTSVVMVIVREAFTRFDLGSAAPGAAARPSTGRGLRSAHQRARRPDRLLHDERGAGDRVSVPAGLGGLGIAPAHSRYRSAHRVRVRQLHQAGALREGPADLPPQ